MLRAKITIVATLVSLLVPVSCGQAARVEPGAGPSDPASMPIAGLIVDTIGYPLTDVQAVVDLRRYDSRFTCMAEAGFSLREEAPPLHMEDFDPRGYAQGAIKRIVDGSVTHTPLPAASDDLDAYNAADMACTAAAESTIADPTQALRRWLGGVAGEIAADVDADPRVVAASTTRDECLARLGVSLGRVSEIEASTVVEADVILDDYRSASITTDEAVDSLRALDTRDSMTLDQPYACIDSWLLVLGEVQREWEERFLSDHRDDLTDELNGIRSDVQSLMASLP